MSLEPLKTAYPVLFPNKNFILYDCRTGTTQSIDLKRFKSLTSGHNMIMGRKTFESFPKPLPNRTHIVITRQNNYPVSDGVIVVNSIEEALKNIKNDESMNESSGSSQEVN